MCTTVLVIVMSQQRKYHSGAEKRKQREQKEREVRIGGHTLFELGVIRIGNQELNTGNSRDIEDLHSLAPSLEQPTMLVCDKRNSKDSYIDRE